MSVIEEAVTAINDKIEGAFEGTAKFVIEGEGSIMLDHAGARASSDDEPADVTLSADTETFQRILEGDLNPTSAFMSGKLSVDGDMGQAMKLAGVLS